jgi:hypothetical protein
MIYQGSLEYPSPGLKRVYGRYRVMEFERLIRDEGVKVMAEVELRKVGDVLISVGYGDDFASGYRNGRGC